MVAAAHPLAAAAGARILGQGGTAFDAAVATCAALNVVEPYMSGLAGLGMATMWVAAERRVRTLDYTTPVPAKFPAGRFAARADLHHGPLSVATPANLAGWCALHRSYGRLALSEVLAPAIGLAEGGFPMVEFNHANITRAAAFFGNEPYFPQWLHTYGCGGDIRPGTILRQPDLARTYRAIAEHGSAYLTEGPLGAAIVETLAALGGCLTRADLAAVAPRWEEPLAAAFRDVLVHTLPPPCEGFQFLLTLRLLDGTPPRADAPDSVAALDRLWRAIRLAAGIRIAHNNPSPEQLAALMSEASVASLRARLADPAPIEGPTEQWLAPPPDVDPQEPTRGHTTSMSIADRDGNVVCITQSLGGLFGSGIVVPGTGVTLNNFLYWGEVDTSGTNALLPGRRLAYPMAPSISTRAGRPVLALGTPGSYGICQTQTQALIRHIDEGLPPQEAIEAPRARLWDGCLVHAEGRIDPDVLEGLRARGHEVLAIEDFSATCGGMQAIALDPDTGAMTGGADPRRDGYVAVP
jgi:gamma-glutamyltranspeptidase/glutathione hydrolase